MSDFSIPDTFKTLSDFLSDLLMILSDFTHELSESCPTSMSGAKSDKSGLRSNPLSDFRSDGF